MDCADRPFEITYISISGQHNLLKAIFYVPRFEMIDDYRLQMSRQNFRTQNYFRQENSKYFIDEKTHFIYFSCRKTACIIKMQAENRMFI